MAKKKQNNIRKKGMSQEARNLDAGRKLIQRNEFAANIVDTIGEEIPRKMGVPFRVQEDGRIYIDEDEEAFVKEQLSWLGIEERLPH